MKATKSTSLAAANQPAKKFMDSLVVLAHLRLMSLSPAFLSAESNAQHDRDQYQQQHHDERANWCWISAALGAAPEKMARKQLVVCGALHAVQGTDPGSRVTRVTG